MEKEEAGGKEAGGIRTKQEGERVRSGKGEKEEDWGEGGGLDMTVLRTCAIQGI